MKRAGSVQERHMITESEGTLLISHEGDAWIVALEGEHDLATSPSLGDALSELFAAGARAVIVDLSSVGFIDSTVLNALVDGKALAEDVPHRLLALVAQDASFSGRLLSLVGGLNLPIYATTSDAISAIQVT